MVYVYLLSALDLWRFGAFTWAGARRRFRELEESPGNSRSRRWRASRNSSGVGR